ncbi:DUF6302 family protein [Streptomyces sp. NPDC052101]|uniref:DUF6302 family protein n=1 Tax=Streptomyces sp. NPDC052101 TaxID=3155763 RepID=UPI003433C61E
MSTTAGMPQSSALSRCAGQGAMMAERLADPALVEAAVEIRLGKGDSCDTCLAVPLGGRRVAGEVTVTGWSQALIVLLALDGKPGFPDLRDGSFSSAIDAPRTIRWGLRTHAEGPRQRARMWGYHDAGVQAYVAEQTRYDPRIPVTPLPALPAAPSVARIYDLLLGRRGDSYMADRAFLRSLTPADAETLSTAAVVNRTHLPAVVSHLTARGIDQFLDLGSGLPAATDFGPSDNPLHDPLHAIVARHHDTARVVYADHDRTLFGFSRAVLSEHPMKPQYVQGDIRYTRQFLTSGRVQHLLDWNRPIAVLLHDVLPWIGTDTIVKRSLAILREQLPPGSAMSITHAADLGDNCMSRFTKAFRAAGITYKPRDPALIEELFGDWPLESPGLVPTNRWHPGHPHAALAPHEAGALAGLAFKLEPIAGEAKSAAVQPGVASSTQSRSEPDHGQALTAAQHRPHPS